MKAQLSRSSHRPAKRYSGVYQQQGRMLTDADWNELMDIVKRRLHDALGDVTASGVPKTGGLVDVGTSPPELNWGRVYVDGVPAEVRPSDPSVGPALDFTKQADFPEVDAHTPSGDHRRYVDVWERPVVSLEDANLRDVGLHGADTCMRTQTMAQVKWCDTTTDPEDTYTNPPRGTAEFALSERAGTTGTDACDPCAREVDIEQGGSNYLFRLEVHAVRDTPHVPGQVTLKWSAENGAEQHVVGNEPDGYKDSDWIYEFYTDTSEKHLGVHLDGASAIPVSGQLETGGYPTVPPAGYDYVRRWDGYCIIAYDGMTASFVEGTHRGTVLTAAASAVESEAGQNSYLFDGGTLKLFLDTLLLQLEVGGKAFVAGDFWLAVARADAPEDDRITVLSAEPTGIVHHYMTIGDVIGGNLVLDASQLRQHSFPPLSNLTADRVGYDPTSQIVRWRDILEDLSAEGPDTVQAAIDEFIANLDASDIPFPPPSCPPATQRVLDLLSTLPDWPDLDGDGATTVNDMLRAFLCHLDSSRIPYDTGAAQTLKAEVDKKVNRAGDTMTGDLTIETNLYVDGNIGAGTRTPLAKLAVDGGLHVGGDSDPGNDSLEVDGTATIHGVTSLRDAAEVYGDFRARAACRVDGDCTIIGNLTVEGTTTTIDTETLQVEDNIIQVNRYPAQPTPRPIDGGLEVFRGGDPSNPNAQMVWDEATDQWMFGVEGSLAPLSSAVHAHSALYRPGDTTADPPALSVDASGRIGIGGPSSTYFRVAISAPTYTALAIQNDDATSATLVAQNVGDGPVATFGGGDVIVAAGHLGIAEVDPGAKLHIGGGEYNLGTTEGDLKVGNINYRLKIGVDTSSSDAGDARIRAHGGTNRLILGAGTKDVLTVKNPQVGINTVEPSSGYRLDVNGSVLIRGSLMVEGGILQEDWTNVEVSSTASDAVLFRYSWVNYGTPHNPAGFYRDKSGVVHLRGFVRNGTRNMIFMLPEGYRPQHREVHPVTLRTGVGRVDILPTGVVRSFGFGSTSAYAYVCLDGITFRVAPTTTIAFDAATEVSFGYRERSLVSGLASAEYSTVEESTRLVVSRDMSLSPA